MTSHQHKYSVDDIKLVAFLVIPFVIFLLVHYIIYISNTQEYECHFSSVEESTFSNAPQHRNKIARITSSQ